MKSIGIVVHHHRADAAVVAASVAERAESHGVDIFATQSDFDVLSAAGLSSVQLADSLEQVDACVGVGGDGTILRAVRKASGHGIGVLGINAGRMGYLAEVEPAAVNDAIDKLVAGELETSLRMMVQVSLEDDTTYLGLNEAVIFRSAGGHSVSVSTEINDREFLNYAADGVIVSTPTGSTAYSLAAGGPVVEPGFEALVLTPVAAHMAFNRSIVLPPTSSVRFAVTGHREAELSIDGQTVAELAVGASVTCTASSTKAKFFSYTDRSFHAVLRDKFSISGGS